MFDVSDPTDRHHPHLDAERRLLRAVCTAGVAAVDDGCSGDASTASRSFETFEAASSEPSLTGSIVGGIIEVLFDLATDFDD